MQNKAQMVEAVLFFNEQGICKEMFYSEFEALLDSVVNMPVFADQQVRLAYVLINPRLMVRAAVFFYLDFDEKGVADRGWNLPLRHLADTAGRGPDLGAGPIRLACRSQCPVSWHQMHLWDPDLSPSHSDLVLIREAVKRNSLGMLVEEEAPVVLPERLNMAAEDQWQSREALEAEVARQGEEKDRQYRHKTAQLIKQQRLRISTLTTQHEEELAKAKLAAQQQLQLLRDQLQRSQQALQQQEALNQSLKQQLSAQVEGLQQARQEMSEQLRDIERSGRSEADLLRAQFDAELQARVVSAVAELREQIAIRDAEQAYSQEQYAQLQQELERMRAQQEQMAGQGEEQILQRLAKMGVVFVVYHPGAGHLTIPLQDMVRYQSNPMSYVAAKCFVSVDQYQQWLDHYQQPTCDASLSTGDRCAMPIDRVETPSRFVMGESNCCSRHRRGARMRSLS